MPVEGGAVGADRGGGGLADVVEQHRETHHPLRGGGVQGEAGVLEDVAQGVAARSTRRGSSEKVSRGGKGVRSSPRLRSSRPLPVGSKTAPPLSSSKAFTVKS